MPYVPEKTPVVYNRGCSSIKAALPGFSLKLNVFGHVNLDSIIGISRQADYVNKVLSPLERAGEIEFCSAIQAMTISPTEQSKKFEDNVSKLLAEEKRSVARRATPKRRPRKRKVEPIFTPMPEPVVEKPEIEKPDEGIDNGTTDG